MPAFTSRHGLALLAVIVCQLLIRANLTGTPAVHGFGTGDFNAYLFLTQIETSLGLIVAMFVGGLVGRQGFLLWALLAVLVIWLMVVKTVFDVSQVVQPTLQFSSVAVDHLIGLGAMSAATVVGVLTGQGFYRAEFRAQSKATRHG